jgi:kynurenine formamidase
MRASGLLLVGVACSAPPAVDPLAAGRWIDLTHPFDSTTIYWPTAQPFRLEVVSAQRTAAGFFYAANNLSAAEHGGTHLDSPIHFVEGRTTTDRIPLGRLIGPAVVVDLAAAVDAGGADYLITVAALEAWEVAHGSVAERIVLLRTGWGARYPDRARYLGTTRTGPAAVAELHFPGLHPNAARWLRDRRVRAVGIDTPSLDYGQSTRFEAHQLLFERDIPGFENVANLDSLPPTGAFVVALPMKITGGSGGPLRIVAMLPGR